ncbi:uncharacterized protein LOC115225698 isoform X1 [Octopus sinensis]|uniref:Uncharacterized protein LOC115225698 isoform X1 n=1 Tax=Octopus sinensis TaxID=2607531 RepID=A0A7E6FSR9_9MOLL|nr:uncharacterized protein LOC115225698 isoform X1 [Octopus sinensis]
MRFRLVRQHIYICVYLQVVTTQRKVNTPKCTKHQKLKKKTKKNELSARSNTPLKTHTVTIATREGTIAMAVVTDPTTRGTTTLITEEKREIVLTPLPRSTYERVFAMKNSDAGDNGCLDRTPYLIM